MNILICDDSSIARKSIDRCIVKTDKLNIFFADNGRQALMLMQQQNIDILFLDLTMPILDGFDVLAALPINTYPTKVVVVSGDIQKEAVIRCKELGAYSFIAKPFKDNDKMSQLFAQLGLIYIPLMASNQPICKDDGLAKFKEVSNIALCKGAAIIADHLHQFIHLPVPHVGPLSYGELKMTLNDVRHRDNESAVSQRFVSGGIHGEALVCLRGQDLAMMGNQLGYDPEHSTYNEIIINISNLLVSSYLFSLGNQLGRSISLRKPVVLEDKVFLLNNKISEYESLFAIEYIYIAEVMDVQCEVLFFLDSASVDYIYDIMETL
ncbi:chemotaxis protein CheC [Vibrio sp. 10N.286.49.B3]|uniref:response regulator n=1 Tax=Vibrio sp. 10N.286.49.B3 TaxID=1880855 RepID=UPI000C8516D9|nr:response regulator [Vibrio sp. 10N.286.49.B3]PMH44933.1 chemotaxis protein CheC [Vibrio sp. 10N.286.49.B3]